MVIVVSMPVPTGRLATECQGSKATIAANDDNNNKL